MFSLLKLANCERVTEYILELIPNQSGEDKNVNFAQLIKYLGLVCLLITVVSWRWMVAVVVVYTHPFYYAKVYVIHYIKMLKSKNLAYLAY